MVARSGTRMRCECCGNTSRWFRACGTPARANARCPHCGSLERHRVLWPHLRAILRPGLRVLHFAPEPVIARNISFFPELHYTAADIDPDRPTLARDVVIAKADIAAQPWSDGSFDIAIVSHVLEHVADDAAAIWELRRVLADGGVVVSQHPYDPRRAHTHEDPSITAPADRARHFGQFDHVRMYGRDLPDRWRQVGFQVTRLHPEAGPGNDILQATRG